MWWWLPLTGPIERLMVGASGPDLGVPSVKFL
jgi:hypothetical protein